MTLRSTKLDLGWFASLIQSLCSLRYTKHVAALTATHHYGTMRRDSDDLAIQPGDHDDDDDDTTSSSGNETPSDSDDEDGRPLTQTISQARAPSPFVDEKVSSVLAGDDVPLFHKLRKAESAVGRAWVAAVTIWAKKPEDTQGAWASLNLALSQIRTLWSARNLPRRMTEMIRIIGMCVAHVFINVHLLRVL